MPNYFKLFALFVSLCVMSGMAQATETLTIAVASSLYSEMQQKTKAFEKEYDIRIRLVSGSTGRLYNQIQQGAPFDVFIAADEKRAELLLKQGKGLSTYSVGQGYLGLMLGDKLVNNLELLLSPSVQHIVIANPDVAPFGMVTKTVLQQQGLWEVLKPKFVYAQNALQASMMVHKGLLDAGFIPVRQKEFSIAVVMYHAVLLKDKISARSWLKTIRFQHVALRTR